MSRSSVPGGASVVSSPRASAGSAAGAASAVPLIQCDSNGRFHMQPAAARLLSGIKGRICPVVVCGPYRTGKSTLLNLLLDTNVKSAAGASFAVGGTVQACTKGLWMWGSPIVLGDCTYIFIDSEGLGSTDQHATFDTQLFSLSLLLSSLFVLNTSGTINEGALEQLELVVQMTERIKVGNKEGAGAGAGSKANGSDNLASLAAYFPSFLWILRDFTLQLVDARGDPMTSNDYLEEALRPVPITARSKAGAAEKNRIRSAISTAFHTRQCVTMVRPAAEESDLQRVSTLASNQLRGEFRNQIESLKRLIPTMAHPKAIDGVELNGKAFVALAQNYIESINTGAVPTIRSAFQSVQEIQGREAMDEAWARVEQAVHAQIESKGDTQVWSDEALTALLASIQDAALQIIREQALGSPADIARLEQQFVAKHLNGLFKALREKNMHRAEKGCGELIASLWSDSGIEDHLPQYESYAELNRDVSGFWAKYLQLTRSNMPERVQIEVGRTFLDGKREIIFKSLFHRLVAQSAESNKLRAAVEANQAQCARLTAELAQVRADAQVGQRQLELELAAATKEGSRLQQQLLDAQQQGGQLQQQMRDMQADTQRGQQQLQGELSALQGALSRAETEVQRVEREKAKLESKLSAIQVEAQSSSAGAAQQSAALAAQLDAARAAHEREQAAVTRLNAEVAQLHQSMRDQEEEANSIHQRIADDADRQADSYKILQQDFAALKAANKKRDADAEQNTQKLKKEKADLQIQIDALQMQLQQAQAQAQSNAAAAAAANAAAAAATAAAAAAQTPSPSASNPLGLPPATRTPLVSRSSLIPNSFSSGAAQPSKRKSAAASAAAAAQRSEDDEEDADMDGGDAFGSDVEEEDEEEEEAAPAAAAAAPAARASKAPRASVSSAAASDLRDPNSMTIAQLKSWLTSLDIAFPQKAQPKAWYVDLAYQTIGEPLEAKFPRGAKAKKAKA